MEPGYAQTASFGDAEEFDSAIDELLAAEGPTLIQLYHPTRRPLLQRPSHAPRNHPGPRPNMAPGRGGA